MVELQRMLADDPGTVTIGLSETQSQVLFRTSAVTFIATLIDGQFPNYPQLIPGEVDTRVVVDTQAFAQAARIASLAALVGAGAALYGAMALLSGAASFADLRRLLGKRAA